MLPYQYETAVKNYRILTSSSSLCCHWCGTPLGNAASVTYLNGNLPCCDLCIMKANNGKSSS